jgi:hypothetical protein
MSHFDKILLANFGLPICRIGRNYRVKQRAEEKAEWIFIGSEAVRKVRYLRGEKLLDIQFSPGEIYRYSAVTAAEVRELLNAASVGNYVNQTFKPHHPDYKKIRE